MPVIDLKFEVLKDTIGQFTGLKDKNGVEIFEGDIVKADDKYEAEVMFYDCAFKFLAITSSENRPWFNHKHWVFEIIGNIHQNKDILNEQ